MYHHTRSSYGVSDQACCVLLGAEPRLGPMSSHPLPLLIRMDSLINIKSVFIRVTCMLKSAIRTCKNGGHTGTLLYSIW